MSGILGVWNVEGEAVPQDLLIRMNERMAHRGPDGASYLNCGSAAFAFQQLRVTPESVREKQPLQSPGGVVALWDGRLDNREELLQLLRGRFPVDTGSADVDLVLAAYEMFRDDFASKLDGDFAVAVFDPSRQTLLLARDAIGVRALNYCRFGAYVLFSSEIKALLLHPAVKTSPNKDSLAEFLFRQWDYGDETNTFFTGIASVPPARLVTITPERIVFRRHFDFDTRRTLRYRTQGEYVEAYGEKFSRAVKNRLRSSFPTAITVSGGIDSSSIYCLAQELHNCGEAISPSFGIGQVGTDVRGNESEFQQAVEDKYGTPIIRQSVSRLTSMRDCKEKIWYSEGLLIMPDAWQDLYAEASRRGARVLLSGFFGDSLVMSPQYILDLILQGKWPTAYRCLRGFFGDSWFPRQEFQIKPYEIWQDLFANLKGYLVPELVRPTYHRVRRMLFHEGVRLPFYSEEFHAVFEAFASRSHAVRLPKSSRAHAKALFNCAASKGYKNRLERDAKSISQYQLEVAYPFFDRELVSFVMAIPGEAVCPDGISRGIHRQAMKGILPEVVRNRRSKGDFTRLGRLGALEDFPRLEECLLDGAARRFNLVKPVQSLKSDLRDLEISLQDESDANALAFWKTLDLLELEQFLDVFFPPEA